MAVLGVFLVALNNAAALAVITGPVCLTGDLYRGDKAEQGTIPALGRVMVNQGQPALVWILPCWKIESQTLCPLIRACTEGGGRPALSAVPAGWIQSRAHQRQDAPRAVTRCEDRHIPEIC